jgi:hypothetical protein
MTDDHPGTAELLRLVAVVPMLDGPARASCSTVEAVKTARNTDDMNWSQLRDRIDRGETGDKKAAEDPAAAPLGTDAEAGGWSTRREHIARSAAAEEAGPKARAAAQGRTVARPHRKMIALGLAATAVVSIILAVALVLAP